MYTNFKWHWTSYFHPSIVIIEDLLRISLEHPRTLALTGFLFSNSYTCRRRGSAIPCHLSLPVPGLLWAKADALSLRAMWNESLGLLLFPCRPFRQTTLVVHGLLAPCDGRCVQKEFTAVRLTIPSFWSWAGIIMGSNQRIEDGNHFSNLDILNQKERKILLSSLFCSL